MIEIVNQIEELVNKTCINSYKDARWNEDHISYTLVGGLQRILDGNTISYNNFTKKLEFKAYKIDGNIEENNGDIAILVNVQFSTGEVLKGVAFLEAKRLYNSGHFDKMNLAQLEGTRDNAPYAQLLEYYPTPTLFMARFPFAINFDSCMWVSPIQTTSEMVSQLSISKNERIIRTSIPFSQFLTGRIIWGLDLDFRKFLYTDVLNNVTSKINPKFLCVLDTFYPNQKKLETIVGDKWEIIG